MDYEWFDISSVLLDQQNPRFEPTASQREAANAMLLSDREKTIRLATDIVNEAAVNPSELPFVLVKDSKHIVIEGNRRFTALKFLRNPDLIDDAPTREIFKKLAAKGKGPGNVMCCKVADRAEARHWIKLRHTGQNEGVGVAPWSADQSNRFDRRRGSQADKAGVLCDVISRTYSDEVDLLANVANTRAGRLTTLGRLVGDPEVRSSLGFEFDGDDLVFQFPREEMLKVFARIFDDLSGSTTVSDIKSKQLRRGYVASMAGDHPDPSTRLPAPAKASTLPTTGGGGGGSGGGGGKGKGGKTNRPETKIFQNVRLPHLAIRTQALLTSARKVPIEDAPAVCAVMIRVILELALTEVGVREGWFTEREKLRKKITTTIKKLDPDCDNATKRNKALEMAWIKSSPGTAEGVAVDEMNAYVHNFMANPDATSVRTLSGWYGPLMSSLNNYAKDHPAP